MRKPEKTNTNMKTTQTNKKQVQKNGKQDKIMKERSKTILK